ncbi:MAG: RluA family pseudouridine synthase [Vicinamibacterales bacterium]
MRPPARRATRLDQRLRADSPSLSWAKARQAIERGQVTVDGAVERDPGALVRAGAAVVVDVNRPAVRPARSRFTRLYEDEHVLVLDKPAGVLTIPAGADAEDEDTVLARVREYMDRRRGPGGYVGTLHRLDRDTSGALAVALTREAHERGRDMFGRHGFTRRYVALVAGVPVPAEGVVDAPIADAWTGGRRRLAQRGEPSKPAVTRYVVRHPYGTAAALVELTLETGRQHQIRLHLAHLGHPVLGDRVYGTPESAAAAPRQMLHARTLAFAHPLTGAPIAVEAPLPDDFARMRAGLRATKALPPPPGRRAATR